MKNDCKNAIRYLVSKTYETYAKYKNSISVLSLPGESWEFENHILNHQDYRNCIQQIHGLERSIPYAPHRPQDGLGPSTQGVWSNHLRSRGHKESAG